MEQAVNKCATVSRITNATRLMEFVYMDVGKVGLERTVRILVKMACMVWTVRTSAETAMMGEHAIDSMESVLLLMNIDVMQDIRNRTVEIHVQKVFGE